MIQQRGDVKYVGVVTDCTESLQCFVSTGIVNMDIFLASSTFVAQSHIFDTTYPILKLIITVQIIDY